MDRDVRIARLASRQWGVVSNDDLYACGLSRDAITTRVQAGRLHRLHRGVYAVGHPNPPLDGRFLAAVLAGGPGAALSHFSAASLHGFFRWDERYPEVIAPGIRRHLGIRVHRTTTLDPQDVIRHGPIPVTTPARTLLDLAATLETASLRRTTRQAQANNTVNVRQILATLERAGPRRGTAKLTRIVQTGPAPTRSELEDVVLDLIEAGGCRRPQINVPIHVKGHRLIPDFRWPVERLILEADGAAYHQDREHDAGRQAILEAHGERVVRVTWRQAVAARRQTLARLRAAGVPRLDLS